MAAHLLTHIYFFIFIFFLYFLLILLIVVVVPVVSYMRVLLFFFFILVLFSLCGSYTGLIAIDALDWVQRQSLAWGFLLACTKDGRWKSPRMIHYCQFCRGLLCHIFEFLWSDKTIPFTFSRYFLLGTRKRRLRWRRQLRRRRLSSAESLEDCPLRSEPLKIRTLSAPWRKESAQSTLTSRYKQHLIYWLS